ncbi:MAG: helix-turn-helix domain-containing protein [Eubacteriaceae bacterium]
MNFGSKLKNLRIEHNMTQQELGKLLNKSSNNISQYETGKREPDIDTLNKLSTILGTTIDYLTGRTTDPTPYRDVNADLDAERDFDAELKELLKGEEMAAFYDFAAMDDATKKEIIEFIRFKKENNK